MLNLNGELSEAIPVEIHTPWQMRLNLCTWCEVFELDYWDENCLKFCFPFLKRLRIMLQGVCECQVE